MKEFFCGLRGGTVSGFFGGPFGSFGWRDALDIVCLTLLLFLIYLFVRDRRAGKLVCGVVIVGVLYGAGVLLDLYGFSSVFAPLFGFGSVALVVIFQPELRAALERIGSVPFRGLRTIGVESRDLSVSVGTVDAVVAAVKDMSFAKTGALIVIERSTRIGEYISSGTILNADTTPELLRAIFYDKAPLHDGAVIIRGGRIHAAGCYLPLSEKDDISKDLATRHRAAIGLSEQSDAICIVVSEETGIISIAYKGELFRGYNSVSLRRKLLELLGKSEAAE